SRLKQRLLRRGITLSAGLLAEIGNSVTAAGPPLQLVGAVLEAATGAPSAGVAALVSGAIFLKLAAKAKFAVAVGLSSGLCVGLGTASRREPVAAQARNRGAPLVAQATQKSDRAAVHDVEEQAKVRGRVLTPDGKPLANAAIYRLDVVAEGKLRESKVGTTG